MYKGIETPGQLTTQHVGSWIRQKKVNDVGRDRCETGLGITAQGEMLFLIDFLREGETRTDGTVITTLNSHYCPELQFYFLSCFYKGGKKEVVVQVIV